MKRILLYLILVSTSLIIISCKKDMLESNHMVKVRINDYPDANQKSQKLAITTTPTTADMFWETGDQFKLINSQNYIYALNFTGISGNTANFTLAKGDSLPYSNYIGVYPATANIISYDSIYFTSNSTYLIDPANLNDYITRSMLMYTKNKYNRTSPNDVIEFKPAMTVLELPIKSDTGSFQIRTIAVICSNPIDTNSGAFIKKACLVINDDTVKLAKREYSNTINYLFSGTNGLTISTTPVSVKLLIWSSDNYFTHSNDTVRYKIDINNGYYNKTIKRTSPFSNSSYYKLPTMIIPRPRTGYTYQGGVICSTYVVNNVTHGYVCAPIDLPMKLPWSLLNDSISTNTGISYGQSNTTNIVTKFNAGLYAAYVCDTLTLNGFNDWFLPSRDELILVHDSLYAKGYGNFNIGKNDFYWTSSQVQLNKLKSIAVNFYKGAKLTESQKNTLYFVRPIRRF